MQHLVRVGHPVVALVLAAGLLSCSGDSTSPPVIESRFLPANAATVEANSLNSAPFEPNAGRFQSVYAASLLNLPTGAEITGIRFRLDGAASAFAAATIDNFEIRLSTSANAPGSLSATFTDNRGADEVVVRAGPLTITPGDYPAGSAPNGFGPVIQFSQSFVYHGGSLLLEIGYTGLPPGGDRGTDNVFPATESQSAYGVTGGFSATSADVGLFMDLIVVEYRFIRP